MSEEKRPLWGRAICAVLVLLRDVVYPFCLVTFLAVGWAGMDVVVKLSCISSPCTWRYEVFESLHCLLVHFYCRSEL